MPINPRLFRTGAATTIADELSGKERLAAPFLGHRDFGTTERHYVRAKQTRASQSVVTALQALRTKPSGACAIARAVIYARYSSELQSASLIADQVRLCREQAVRDDHAVAEVFSDEALSGGHLASRPGIQALMQRGRRGDIDLVIAESLDRLSRDQEDVSAIFKRLAHVDVSIATLTEGVINELHIGLKGTMNALYLKDLAEKTRRGQRGRVEAGKIPGGKSYGYRILREMRADGSVTKGEREIDPAEASIVRRIVEAYAAGRPPRAIATTLNGEGIPGPRGGSWNASTINGSQQRRNGILNNELYLGRITYNRQRFLKDPETGKRVSRQNPEALWVTKDVPALRIFGDDLWQSVQAIKARYASQRGNKRQTKKRLLSGLIRCGRCGGAMTLINRGRYYCSAKRGRGTCDSTVRIGAADLEDRVLDGLRSILFGQKSLVEEFTTAFKAELARLRRTRHRRDRDLSKDLAKVERGIRRCLDFIAEGDGDPASVGPMLKAFEAQKRDLVAQINNTPGDAIVDLHPNIAELYRRKVTALQELLSDEETRVEAMETIRSLIAGA